MENLVDYSGYVNAAYGLTTLILSALLLVVITKYFSAKSRLKK